MVHILNTTFFKMNCILREILPSDLPSLDCECSGSSCLKKLALDLIITNRCEFPPRDATNLKNGFYLDQKWFWPEIDKNTCHHYFDSYCIGDLRIIEKRN